MVPVLEVMFEEEHRKLEAARQESRGQLDVFACRVGELRAEVLCLNALGGRLAEMAGLDTEEFDFENSLPLGGPTDAWVTNEVDLTELLREVADLFGLIDDRRHKLKQLEQMVMEKSLGKHAIPSGLSSKGTAEFI